jgi:putative PIN family toxin of toxin-antitoxin system
MELALLWVVVDTSVWVSAILTPSGPPGRIVRAFRDGRIQVVMSEYLFAELAEVLERPRIKRRHTDRDDASMLLALLRSRARTVLTTGTIRAYRDAKDDLIVETAISGGARYLVSRDEDLTRDPALVSALREHGVDVLTVAHFLELLDADQA